MITLKQARTKNFKMGLEQMGIQLFEGAETHLTPAIVGNKVQTGYDEVREKETIKIIENHYGRPLTDLNFYGSLILVIPHSASTLDPKNGVDLLKLGVLRAKGKLAPTVADQDDVNKNYQFVMVDERQEASLEASIYKKRGQAHSIITEIMKDDPAYLIALCQYNCNYASNIKSAEAAYVKLVKLIDGNLSEKKEATLDSFMSSLDPKYGGDINKVWLATRVIVAAAVYFNIIRFSSQKGYFYNTALPDGEGVEYGRNLEGVTDFLTRMENSDHIGTGTEKDHPWSIRYQLVKRGAQV